jgi:hypothetical protein
MVGPAVTADSVWRRAASVGKEAVSFIGLLTSVAMLGWAPSPQPPGPFGRANPFTAWVGASVADLSATLIELRFAGKGKKFRISVGITGGTDPLAAENALEVAFGQKMQASGVARRFVVQPDQLRRVLKTVATFAPAPPAHSVMGIYGIQMTSHQKAALLLGASGKQDLATLAAALPTPESQAAVLDLSKQVYPY